MWRCLYFLSFVLIYCWQKNEEVESFRERFAGSQADRMERAEAEAVKVAEQLRKTKVSGYIWFSFPFSSSFLLFFLYVRSITQTKNRYIRCIGRKARYMTVEVSLLQMVVRRSRSQQKADHHQNLHLKQRLLYPDLIFGLAWLRKFKSIRMPILCT